MYIRYVRIYILFLLCINRSLLHHGRHTHTCIILEEDILFFLVSPSLLQQYKLLHVARHYFLFFIIILNCHIYIFLLSTTRTTHFICMASTLLCIVIICSSNVDESRCFKFSIRIYMFPHPTVLVLDVLGPLVVH